MRYAILPLFLGALLAPALPAAEPVRLVPTPRATLLTSSATNRPFLGAAYSLLPVNLAAAGYVEQEYTVSGHANIYEWGAQPADPVTVRTAAVSYTTRLLVRRPEIAARFSGRVVVELLNPTGLYDFAPLWGFSQAQFLRRGDAWVGVTVKPVAATTLQRFDPVRYAALNFAYTQAPGCRPAGGSADAPGVDDGRANPPDAENGLAWDIIAQVGALLRSSSKENPLVQLNPRHVIAAGYSQTGSYLTTYVNALHHVLRLGGGEPIYDGYMNAAGRMGSVPINQCATPLSAGDPRSLVQPRDVPFISVMTQSDFNRQPAQRMDDSDEPGREYRLYEIAGSAHSGPFAAGQPATKDLTIAGFEAPSESLCAEERGEFPLGYAFNAVWQQFGERLANATSMISVPRIEVAGAAPVVDEWGNAVGGWRLPQIDVPVATYGGVSTPRANDARSRFVCSLTGSVKRYDPARLKQLYRDRNEYVRRFNAAVDRAVQERRLVAEDAAILKSTAVRSVPAF